jgi:hypothetical protein
MDGKYVDKKTDVAYFAAPLCYEPLAIGTEVYGVLGNVQLFTIVGADPTKWLCDASGTVFYADNIELPTLDAIGTSYAELVFNDLSLGKITEAERISALTGAYASGTVLEKPSWGINDLEINWRIKFTDESIGIFYVLEYYEVKEDYIVTDAQGNEINYGKRFLFNRFDGRKMVAVGDVLASEVEQFKALNQVDADKTAG